MVAVEAQNPMLVAGFSSWSLDGGRPRGVIKVARGQTEGKLQKWSKIPSRLRPCRVDWSR